jgi:hypothetical protein
MISAILIFLSAIANAIGDKIQFHWDGSIFAGRGWDSWANPKISWRRKWKWKGEKYDEMIGEAFPGSSTVFVWITDLWHLSKSFQLTLMMLAICWWNPIISANNFWFGCLINFAILRIIYGVTFELFFSKILSKKKMSQIRSKVNDWLNRNTWIEWWLFTNTGRIFLGMIMCVFGGVMETYILPTFLSDEAIDSFPIFRWIMFGGLGILLTISGIMFYWAIKNTFFERRKK